MNMNELIQTTPISVEKSVRVDEIRSITSARAGVIMPLAFIPLLREDRVSRGELRINFDMAETLHPLLNSVNVKVMVHFISHLAFERFDGFDSFNRSYQGIPEPSTGNVISFFHSVAFNKAHMIWNKLGVQWREGIAINNAPIEAYNLLVNWRRRARTDKLPERLLTDTTLAEAFWKNTTMSDIVPDWDQSALDGEVPLSFVDSRVKIKGLVTGVGGTGTPALVNPPANVSGNDPNTGASAGALPSARWVLTDSSWATPRIFGELAESGITVSLANIELAKQTAAFAKLRERFDGIDDDHIIDLLMEGIRVPDEAMKQPILLASQSTVFGMQERHAMDGDNLDLSRTTGSTVISTRFRTPPMNTGGLVYVTAEIVPEQLYERQKDYYLALNAVNSAATLPNFMRDYLDPEKVQIVPNDYVDVHHATPSAVFGYQPLNNHWKRSLTRAGGKFYRPNPDTFVEDRMRFWSADQVNPTLVDDFYMVSDLPHTVFADTVGDPFEIVTLGQVSIIGNTVFGDPLTEDTNAYEDIMEQVDTGRIDQVPVPTSAQLLEDGDDE